MVHKAPINPATVAVVVAVVVATYTAEQGVVYKQVTKAHILV
jgi:hypothetical protein